MIINRNNTFRITLLFSLDLLPKGEIENTESLFTLKGQFLCFNLFIQFLK